MSTTNTIYPAARICADYIAEALSTTTKRPLFVGFQGPQGSGKTTLTNQTKSALLALPTPINATVFSIDDLYLPYEGLTALARSHPENALLQGRGQPGTHDPKLGGEILERLSRGEEVSVPIFDKSRYGGYGDRSSESVVVRLPVDVVILEGWCFGFRPLAEAELKERYEATGNESRAPYFKSHSIKSLTGVNDNLRSYAELWYPYFTHFIQIVPENLYDVFEWRLQQEHAMKLKNGGQGMSDDEVHNFVARYMPGYELFQHTIEDQSNPWVGHGIKIVLDKQRIVVKTGSF